MHFDDLQSPTPPLLACWITCDQWRSSDTPLLMRKVSEGDPALNDRKARCGAAGGSCPFALLYGPGDGTFAYFQCTAQSFAHHGSDMWSETRKMSGRKQHSDCVCSHPAQCIVYLPYILLQEQARPMIWKLSLARLPEESFSAACSFCHLLQPLGTFILMAQAWAQTCPPAQRCCKMIFPVFTTPNVLFLRIVL